jgi:GNAT superfamily N-acetyltransferase
MGTTEAQSIDREEVHQIYGAVASHDGADLPTMQEAVPDLDPEDVEENVETLVAAGYLRERGGAYHLSIPGDAEWPIEGEDATCTIRVVRSEDFPEIKSVIEAVTAEKTYIEAETVAEELDRDESLIRFDEDTSRIFFGATVEGDMVGWLHIEAAEREKLKHTARFTVGVIDEYRGKGIGKQLMTSGLEWAKAHGYHKVYNDFPATNRGALAFLDTIEYEAHNEAVRRDHYMIDGELVDQMSLAVYLENPPSGATHFDRVVQEAEALYEG